MRVVIAAARRRRIDGILWHAGLAGGMAGETALHLAISA